VDARVEHGQLEQPARTAKRDRFRIARCRRVVDARVQIEEEHQDRQRCNPTPMSAGDREGEERGDAQARDRQEPLGHARKAKGRQRVPHGRVDRRARPEREDNRHDNAEPEHRGERIPARTYEQDEADERDHRRNPAEEDELLAAALSDVTRDEVARVRRVARDLRELATSRLRRPLDEGLADEHARENGRHCAEPGPDERTPVASPANGVQQEERNRAEGEVHLSRERDRRDCRR
jgi:hypothetical protein